MKTGKVFEIPLAGAGVMRFRHIRAGSFFMGQRGIHSDEEPAHRVQITRPFWMAETPVTQAQFDVWKATAGLQHEHHFKGRPAHPAENMTWWQAVDFCRWLTPQLPEGWLAALPTEAEWEYACRAGTRSDYHTGDGEDALKQAGWYEGNSGSSTRPVGQKEKNEWDLYDMHGNVWEWCFDAWDDHAYRKRADGICDPDAVARDAFFRSESGKKERSDAQPRCLRGGSWCNHATNCRAAIRFRYHPGNRIRDIGFRVVLVPGPLKPSPDAGHPARKQAGGVAGGGTTPETEPAGGRGRKGERRKQTA